MPHLRTRVLSRGNFKKNKQVAEQLIKTSNPSISSHQPNWSAIYSLYNDLIHGMKWKKTGALNQYVDGKRLFSLGKFGLLTSTDIGYLTKNLKEKNKRS